MDAAEMRQGFWQRYRNENCSEPEYVAVSDMQRFWIQGTGKKDVLSKIAKFIGAASQYSPYRLHSYLEAFCGTVENPKCENAVFYAADPFTGFPVPKEWRLKKNKDGGCPFIRLWGVLLTDGMPELYCYLHFADYRTFIKLIPLTDVLEGRLEGIERLLARETGCSKSEAASCSSAMAAQLLDCLLAYLAWYYMKAFSGN